MPPPSPPTRFEIARSPPLYASFVSTNPAAALMTEVLSAQLPFFGSPPPPSASTHPFLSQTRRALIDFCSPTFPCVFREVVEEYLLFFTRVVLPYLLQRQGAGEGEGLTVDYMYVVAWLGNPEYKDSIARRWSCGLLREGQVRLIGVALRMVMDEVRALMEVGAGMKEVQLAVQNGRNLVTEFLGCWRFRSERLERLLVRYLCEPGVDRGVVEGLERKTREYRTAFWRVCGELEERLPPRGVENGCVNHYRKEEILRRSEFMRDPGNFRWGLHPYICFDG